MSPMNQPLTNLQLELLKLFSLELPEEDLIQIQRLIAKHFADKASDERDRLWEENGWSDETMVAWLGGKTTEN